MSMADQEREQVGGLIGFIFVGMVIIFGFFGWCLSNHPKPTLIITAILGLFATGLYHYTDHERAMAHAEAADRKQFAALYDRAENYRAELSRENPRMTYMKATDWDAYVEYGKSHTFGGLGEQSKIQAHMVASACPPPVQPLDMEDVAEHLDDARNADKSSFLNNRTSPTLDAVFAKYTAQIEPLRSWEAGFNKAEYMLVMDENTLRLSELIEPFCTPEAVAASRAAPPYKPQAKIAKPTAKPAPKTTATPTGDGRVKVENW